MLQRTEGQTAEGLLGPGHHCGLGSRDVHRIGQKILYCTVEMEQRVKEVTGLWLMNCWEDLQNRQGRR